MTASPMVYHIGKAKEKSEIREFPNCGEDTSNQRALNAAPATVLKREYPQRQTLISRHYTQTGGRLNCLVG